MFETVHKRRRRVSIVELAVVIGTLVVLAAIIMTLAGNHQNRSGETAPATSQAPTSPTINAGIAAKNSD